MVRKRSLATWKKYFWEKESKCKRGLVGLHVWNALEIAQFSVNLGEQGKEMSAIDLKMRRLDDFWNMGTERGL